jgi:hypothetical protein
MFQFTRAIYRELAPEIDVSVDPAAHRLVIDACDRSVTRLATDRRHFARPAKTLFMDIRPYFPVGAQAHVLRVVSRYMAIADEALRNRPPSPVDALGNRLRCEANTRRGTPCRRSPHPENGYCPSHQHLAEFDAHETAVAA